MRNFSDLSGLLLIGTLVAGGLHTCDTKTSDSDNQQGTIVTTNTPKREDEETCIQVNHANIRGLEGALISDVSVCVKVRGDLNGVLSFRDSDTGLPICDFYGGSKVIEGGDFGIKLPRNGGLRNLGVNRGQNRIAEKCLEAAIVAGSKNNAPDVLRNNVASLGVLKSKIAIAENRGPCS